MSFLGGIACFINLHDGIEFEDSLSVRRVCRRCGVYETSAGWGGGFLAENWYPVEFHDLEPFPEWELETERMRHWKNSRGRIFMVALHEPYDLDGVRYVKGVWTRLKFTAWESCDDITVFADDDV